MKDDPSEGISTSGGSVWSRECNGQTGTRLSRPMAKGGHYKPRADDTEVVPPWLKAGFGWQRPGLFGRATAAGILFAFALLALPVATAWAENNTFTLFTEPIAWDNGLNVLGEGGTNNHIEVRGCLFECLYDFIIGHYGDNNSVLVTEGGLWWPWRDVWIGYGSSFNGLTIRSGTVDSKYLTLGELDGDRYNLTAVTGTNSVLSCDWINVGAAGSENLMTISHGGKVAGDGYIGSDPTANDNAVSVNGSGSIWTNYALLVVGHSGSANSLSITDGGRVESSGRSYIGRHYDGSNNTVLVTGAGSVWTNGDLRVGEDGDANSLTIADGGRVSGALGCIAYSSGSVNNSVLVTGTGSVWSNSDILFIGYEGMGNSLTITNGGRVLNTLGYVGNWGEANRALVTGPGSTWNNSGELRVGSFRSWNHLTIAAGGLVANTAGFVGGHATNADHNTALVAGSGSVWTHAADLTIGESGSNNGLAIGDGGRVSSQNGTMGLNETAHNNSVVVTASGSLWNNSGSLTVGSAGSGNGLTLSDGGRANDADGTIGSSGSASNNAVFVIGPGSVWNNSGSLMIGASGSVNNLTITNSGRVGNTYGYIGDDSGANDNAVLVTGAGSIWSNRADLYVGQAGAGNSLTIVNGGFVISDAGITVGRMASAFGNSVFATGAGSIASVGLTMGDGGAHNNSVTLLTNTVWNLRGGSLTWGSGAGAISNSLVIDATSALTNIVGLTLGDNDTAFAMTNSAGGFVLNGLTSSRLQFSPSGFGGLTVGPSDSHGTSLSISNYVLKTTAASFIGYGSSNAVRVGGAGALWSNSNSLYVGNGGPGNNLSITNGGTVTAPNIVIGAGFSTFGNRIAVADANLYATTAATGGVLEVRGGTLDFSGGIIDVDWLSAINNTASATNSIFNFNAGILTTRSGSQIVVPRSTNFIIGTLPGRTATWNVPGGLNTLQPTIGSTSTSVLGGVTGAAGLVNVTGAGTVWSNAHPLSVGGSSSGSQLTVTHGGRAYDTTGSIGFDRNASNNSALVTGTGSLWSSSDLRVGYSGTGNSLTIVNSGRVANASGTIGSNGSASNNQVFVTGSGSVWANSLDATLGSSGSGNGLTVTQGGQVLDVNGRIGSVVGANGNTALVDGAGSVWSNSADLFAGQSGSSNSLTIASSGRAAATYGYIGYNGSASDNAVFVTGAGSVWSNRFSVYVGYSGAGNSLTITNGGVVAGYYTTGYIGYNGGANSNKAFVTGSGSLWKNNTELDIGYSGAGNGLTIANGGRVLNTFGYIGRNGNANNNAVLVTDTGSVWSTSNPLYVGCLGAGNSLTVANGGRVANTSYGYVGDTSSASNNTALVIGTGSVWSNNNGVIIGNSGAGNRLTVTNGGQVFDSGGTLGYLPGANNNAAVVDGSGSGWNNGSYVTVGDYGVGNSLTIANGGLVANTQGHIGDKSGSTNNTVFVTGAGSLWDNNGVLFVGNYGAGNGLTLVNTGRVASTSGYIGYNSSASNNAMFIAGSGSVWNNGGELHVGAYSTGNSLTVTNGGQVLNTSSGYIGSMASGSNNTALVTGTGSVWSNRLDLYVGLDGASNRLILADGARVANTSGRVGSKGRANAVLVTGFGSIWSNRNILTVGEYGAGNNNSLTVTNGGQVNADSLYIGYYGAGNGLTIAAGGRVTNNYGGIGVAGSASNNTAIITGSGSVWSNNSVDVRVGDAGAGNRLTVTNGGQFLTSGGLYIGYAGVGNSMSIINSGRVANTWGYIGYLTGASNNAVVVTGTGSVWSNSVQLWVGRGGADNQLIVTNGGVVNVGGDAFVGYDASTPNSQVLVAGGNLNVAGSLAVRCGALNINSGRVVAGSLLTTNGTAGVVHFNGGVAELGAMTVTGTGAPTTIGNGTNAATLRLNGAGVFQGGLHLANNATLSGVSRINDPVTVLAGGVLSPGNSPGTQTFGSLTLNTGAAIASEIASPFLYDQVVATNLTVNGVVAWNAVLSESALAATHVFKIVDVGSYLGAITNNWLSLGGTKLLNEGAFFTLPGPDGSNHTFQISYAGNGLAGGHGNDVVLTAYASGDVAGIDFKTWLAAYNLSTNGSADFIDSDGDGMNNSQEYGAGTDPSSSNSVLRIIGIAATGGAVRVGWTGGVQAWQFLDTCADLRNTGAVWQAIWTNPPPTTVVTNFLDSIAVTDRFYRVRAQRN